MDKNGRRFKHETLFYTGDDGFLGGTVPFLKDALAAQEPVMVAVCKSRIELLRDALGEDAAHVRFMDISLLGRNPARIIPVWQQFLKDSISSGRSARGIGEPVWPERSADELAEYERHEALLNVAFDDGPEWRLLCPYDVGRLDELVIEAARQSHPVIVQDGGTRSSDRYVDAQAATSPFEGTLEPSPDRAKELAFTRDDLATVRHAVSEWASAWRLDAERIEHLVLAVNELTTNSVRYGGGGGGLRMWSDGDALLIDVRDHGHIREPLVGRVRPAPDQHAGRGLWLVNQLCDLVQIRSSPAGSLVRLHMKFA